MPVVATFGPTGAGTRRSSMASNRAPAPQKKGRNEKEEEAAPLMIDAEVFIAQVKLKITEALDMNSAEVGFLAKGTKVAIRRRAEVATMCAVHTAT